MKSIAAIVAAAMLLAPSAGHAVAIYVQAEDFLSSYNVLPEEIRADGTVLKGLDCAEEWTEYELMVPTFGTYMIQMRCWGNLNVPYRFDLIALGGDGSTQTIQFSYTGKGSCGS